MALSVATRCPRCGHEFASSLLQPLPQIHQRAWLRPALGLAGVVAVVLGLALLSRGGRSAPLAANAPVAPVATPSADTSPPAPVAAPPVPKAPPAASPAASRAASQTAPPSAAEPPAPPATRRYAVDWVNVRPRRGMSGAPVLVLRPGDSVLVDSLRRGWYRIVQNGRAVGYAHRRFFAASPAGAGAP